MTGDGWVPNHREQILDQITRPPLRGLGDEDMTPKDAADYLNSILARRHGIADYKCSELSSTLEACEDQLEQEQTLGWVDNCLEDKDGTPLGYTECVGETYEAHVLTPCRIIIGVGFKDEDEAGWVVEHYWWAKVTA